ncbi:hypothetical protein [Methanolobus chelungpuianus]|uniref:hypothetical protein n=1 Tax=Methanolobus chelungpuianus TaxID=502115 RepID=UPI002113FE3A|nr:hypothetical protein [Methanolobus chelungpuianus]
MELLSAAAVIIELLSSAALIIELLSSAALIIELLSAAVLTLSEDVELFVSAALPLKISTENSIPIISNNPVDPAISLIFFRLPRSYKRLNISFLFFILSPTSDINLVFGFTL